MEIVSQKQICNLRCKSCVKRRCKAYHAAKMRAFRAKRKAQIAELKALVDKLGRAA